MAYSNNKDQKGPSRDKKSSRSPPQVEGKITNRTRETTTADALLEGGIGHHEEFPGLGDRQQDSSNDRIDIIVTNSRDEKNEERVSQSL